MIAIIELNFFRKRFSITPTQVMVAGFALIIFIGALLLNTPFASRSGERIGFINALFTSTSAVCVTGLVVVDTGTYWSLFGQTVIIALIQVGGLGFMTMSTLFALLIGRRITLKERLLMQEALNLYDLQGLVRLTKSIIITTFAIEALGAALYACVFVPIYGWKSGIAMGIFHAISAFCNAGFDVIGGFRGFTPFVNNWTINITTMLLIIIGGLGFAVWTDIYKVVKHRSRRYISLHSKIVFVMTGALIIVGFVFFFALEFNNPNTVKNLPWSGKILAPLFQSVTPRTAGYNTLDIAALTTPSKFMTILMMFIGGSPGSTAGGIKTATFGILLLTVMSVVWGREDVEAFEKRIPKYLIYRSLAIAIIGLCIIAFVTMVLSITEQDADFLTVLFESTSAFGTVGLSLNFTPTLSDIGRIIISLTMFAGRVGPLSLVLAFATRATKYKSNIKYPEDRIMVG